MASSVQRNRHNILGAAGGVPNVIVYLGPELDMTAGDSPITSANTLKVWRYNESTGAPESYTPGSGGDFTTLDRGSLAGSVAVGLGLGRGYVIVAKADFTLDHAVPA